MEMDVENLDLPMMELDSVDEAAIMIDDIIAACQQPASNKFLDLTSYDMKQLLTTNNDPFMVSDAESGPEFIDISNDDENADLSPSIGESWLPDKSLNDVLHDYCIDEPTDEEMLMNPGVAAPPSPVEVKPDEVTTNQPSEKDCVPSVVEEFDHINTVSAIIPSMVDEMAEDIPAYDKYESKITADKVLMILLIKGQNIQLELEPGTTCGVVRSFITDKYKSVGKKVNKFVLVDQQFGEKFDDDHVLPPGMKHYVCVQDEK